jgi:hypothetical protein
MKVLSIALALAVLSLAVPAPLEAAPKPKKAAKEPAKGKKKKGKVEKVVATKQTFAGIEALMGKFKWGMSPGTVTTLLEKQIRDETEPLIKAAPDPMVQDRMRKELEEKVKKLKSDYLKFTGKKTPWDVSLVEKEFAHKNNEAMVVIWTKKERRFFFFFNDRLWKLYIAFNAELFQGKTFVDFAASMEGKFGPSQKVATEAATGEAAAHRQLWPPAGNTLLMAIDNTGFYGNFCLVLLNGEDYENVKTGRKINSPPKDYNDPLVEAVTKGGDEMPRDENEDIVDRITGKGSKVPKITSDSGSGPSTVKPKSPGSNKPVSDSPPPSKKKKVNTKDPLDGLDI